jgi:hypothetical protein
MASAELSRSAKNVVGRAAACRGGHLSSQRTLEPVRQADAGLR